MYQRYLNGEYSEETSKKNSFEDEDQRLHLKRRLKSVLKINEDSKVSNKSVKGKRSSDKGKPKLRSGVLNGDKKFLLKQGFEPKGYQWKTKQEINN